MPNNHRLVIDPPQPFDFHSTITSHGWAVLLPNAYNPETNSVIRVDPLPSGKVAHLNIGSDAEKSGGQITVDVQTARPLNQGDERFILNSVRHMLRLDEDYSGFYKLCRKKGGAWKNLLAGKGRMIRSPSLFEDLVKVICTTNIQWGGTKRMVGELVDVYGKPFDPDPALKTFPEPESIAGDAPEVFKTRVNLGYRAEYIHGLAVNIAEGSFSLDDLKDESVPTAEVRKKLKSIKGIGDYAAASMLMLLGRYDEIPVDTVFRDFMSQNYFDEGAFDPKAAVEMYADWGEWKSLAYWFEMLESE